MISEIAQQAKTEIILLQRSTQHVLKLMQSSLQRNSFICIIKRSSSPYKKFQNLRARKIPALYSILPILIHLQNDFWLSMPFGLPQLLG